MATLFYEPSTRTRLSFESAMHRLGGAVISSADMHASSAAKGESLADTVRVVGAYADLIVLRHPHDGAARVAAEYAPCPVLNAGDGSREHPTQTLCDLYILRKKKGRLKGLTVAICGDLKYGRTVHSLIYALARFGANIVAVPPAASTCPTTCSIAWPPSATTSFSTVAMDELKSLAGGLDALYLTPSAPHQMALFTGGDAARRFPGERSRRRSTLSTSPACNGARRARKAGAGDYIRFDAQALKTSRTHEAVVMHPLPRTDELAYELDSDPRAVYFEQAAAGVPVRMALIAWLIEKVARRRRQRTADAEPISFKSEPPPRCANPNCITRMRAPTCAAIQARRRARARCAGAAMRFLRPRAEADFVGHARSHRYYRFDESLYGYVRQWIEEGSLAVFDSEKQAEEHGYEPYRRGPQREIMNEAGGRARVRALADQLIADVPGHVGRVDGRNSQPRRDARASVARSDRSADAESVRRAPRSTCTNPTTHSIRSTAPRSSSRRPHDRSGRRRDQQRMDRAARDGDALEARAPGRGQAGSADRSRASRSPDPAELRRQEHPDRARRARAGASRGGRRRPKAKSTIAW